MRSLPGPGTTLQAVAMAAKSEVLLIARYNAWSDLWNLIQTMPVPGTSLVPLEVVG